MIKVLIILQLFLTLLLAEKIYVIEALVVKDEIVFEADSNKHANGLLRVYYKDGSIKTEVPLRNGRSSGLEKKYYRSGTLATAIMFHHGKENGMAIKYYPTGLPEYETNFKHGYEEGSSKAYYPDGKLKSEIFFKHGEAMQGYKIMENGRKITIPKNLLKWIQPNTGVY